MKDLRHRCPVVLGLPGAGPSIGGWAGNGFTMIELLIVIGIICVLALLSIPIAGRLTDSSNLIKSVSNVRSIQTANQQYAGDHDGSYVPVLSTTPWYRNIEFVQYLGGRDGMWPKSLLSPKSLNQAQSYGYNASLFSTAEINADPKVRNLGLKITSIPKPSTTMAFADALDYWIRRENANQYKGVEQAMTWTTAYRYRGRTAVSYFDGHAEALRRDDVVGNITLWGN